MTMSIDLVQGVAAIAAADWDACAGPDNPFVSHAFFSCVEATGCAAPRTGWAPHHLVLRDAAGVAGILPLYLKSHSQGEYVFDHGWAQAYERAGGRYYPKFQASVPFTPVPGPRFLVAPGRDRPEVERQLAATAITLARDNHLSSLHITFTTEGEWQRLGEQGFLQRTDQQFHWENQGYANFDHFLEALAARKRKQVKRERRDACLGGVDVVPLTGDQLTPAHWDAFYECYITTGARKWGTPYLNRAFFAQLHDTMRDKVLLVMARRDGQWIAGALNLIGSDTLYGRNWGAIDDQPFLHFEVCYYQAIDFALARGLKRVEAGAQGTHKIARGYLPSLTYSLHWIADPGFRGAVEHYLTAERAAVDRDREALAELAPFKRGGGERDMAGDEGQNKD